MPKKIDDRLQQAVQKGFKKKQSKQQEMYNKQRAEKEAHDKEIKKWLPKAKRWVDKYLFDMIAEEESTGRRELVLPKSVADDIPTEAVHEVIKGIDGLQSWWKEDILWQDNDFGNVTAMQLHIQWTSADPNLNRNDR